MHRTFAAYSKMKNFILSGEWPPGFQAFEPEIATQLGMSRTPIRQALIKIEAEGLIRIVPRRGIYVIPLSIENVSHVYHVLIALESMAAELAAKLNHSKSAIKLVTRSIQQMEKAASARDIMSWSAADSAFHDSILHLADNPYLVEMAKTFRDRIQQVKALQLRFQPDAMLLRSIKEHRGILDAITRRDEQAASFRAREHRLGGLQMITDIIEGPQR